MVTAERAPGEGAAGVLSLRRHPSFLKLWTGQSVSLPGSSVTTLALPLTAISTLHADAEQAGLLKAVLWLPYLLIALWASAWCDRHRRRRVMIVANSHRRRATTEWTLTWFRRRYGCTDSSL
jgi:hypothetical protein